MEISIIIPAYNEERRILRTLEDYYHTFSTHFGDNFELIVEMDGCSDNTPKIVKEFAKGKLNVRVLEFPIRLGKGAGLREAFKIAEGKIVGFTDADGSTPPEEFLRLIKEIERGHDVVLGSRWLPESRVLIPQPLYRRILSRGFNILVRLLMGIDVRDTQCGAKVMRRKVVEMILNDLRVNGFSFDVEMLYLAKNYGFKILEVPIEWRDDSNSRLNLRRVVPEMFVSLMALRLYYSPLKSITQLLIRNRQDGKETR